MMDEWMAPVAAAAILTAMLGIISVFKLYKTFSDEDRIFSKPVNHSEIKSLRQRQRKNKR